MSDRALATWLVVPTVAVVVMLGIVQYRWSDQVSSATSVRLADSLQMSMMNWHLTLFRSLSDACQRMVLPLAGLNTRELEQATRRFHEQQATAEFPQLVDAVDVVPEDHRLAALRWNRATGRFEPLPERPPLDARRQRLIRSAASGTSPPSPVNEPAAAAGGLRDWRFDPEGPALVRAIRTPASVFDSRSASAAEIAAWLILPLDLDVLGDQLLPELARRFFTGIDGLDYQVAVVTGPPPRHPIYSSDPTFATDDVRDADGKMNVFGRPLQDAAGSIYVFQSLAGAAAQPIAATTPWFSLEGSPPPISDWQLVVRHRRGGALGAFVAQTRRRDLAISFSLLLLLVLSMTVWLIVVNRAQRLARLQMNFVAAVSHDLRTPLTVIASAADNIAHGLVREQEQLAHYGTTIGRQARKLSELVDRVLLFAASRESAHRYSPQPIDISVAIDTALEGTAELIQASRVVVERDVESNLPAVTGDPVGLLQCLQNLMTNAVKYGGQGRWMAVRAVLSTDQGVPEIQVSISDHGIGMSPSDLRRIFTPFFRSPSIANDIRGTGLGLAVARSVVESMNGRLTAVSAPGEGSTFTLHIPVTS